MIGNITWSQTDLDNHDLCGKHNGYYVDVVKHYTGVWTCYYNNIRIFENITTIDEAKKLIEEFVKTL